MATQVTLRSILQNVAITGTQLYVTRPVNYSTIHEADFINRVHNDSGIPAPMLRAVLNSLMTIMKEELLNGHSVSLGPIGILAISAQIKACDDPKDVSVNNVKRLRVRIYPSTEMKQAMMATKLVQGLTPDGRGVVAPSN